MTCVEYWHTADGLFHEVDNRRILTQRVLPSLHVAESTILCIFELFVRTTYDDFNDTSSMRPSVSQTIIEQTVYPIRFQVGLMGS